MAKCSKCGRKGIFLKLEDGLCANCQHIVREEQEVARLKAEQCQIQSQISILQDKLDNRENLYNQITSEARSAGIEQAKKDMAAERRKADDELADIYDKLKIAREESEALQAKDEKAQKSVTTAVRKVEKSRDLIRAIDDTIRNFANNKIEDFPPVDDLLSEIENFVTPTVTLDLQCLSMRDLRKRYRQNEKHIQETLEKYKGRYTTKANATIYSLMVIALQAELQNVLYNLGFGKLDDALQDITNITQKYLAISTDGNQSIAPTIRKFIGEIDFFFHEAVRIEYEYYVQKERAKEEQRAIREQMRQEAADKKALEAERKKIEKEESKYQTQIEQVQAQMTLATDDDGKIKQLEAHLAELQAQLNSVQDKKEEITNLQNGKAGNVYVISNLGSFGPDVFKIGMTRRLEPQDRVDELGSASVPFPFDVHCFIFSDDAVALENKIHKILNEQRVNKVNLRKEFFRVSLDDLEKLVAEIEPTASFKRTMLAEQYNQSLSISQVGDNIVISEEDDSEE